MDLKRALYLALTVASVGALGCAHHGHSHPGPRAGGGGHRGVSVTGVGEVRAKPDIARAQIGVEIRAPQADQATKQAEERMGAVLAALKAAGVAENDLRTQSLSVNFEREYQPPAPPVPLPVEPPPTRAAPKGERAAPTVAPAPAPAPEPQGFYRVSNMVEVTIRDLNRAGQILAAATNAGANQMWGISLEVSDTAPFIAEARGKAIAQAKQNAEQLAQLTGVKLGPIVSISDGAMQQGPGPVMAMRAEAAMQAMPVERGELTLTHQVSVVYALPGRACDKHDD